jgi:hypothetical protein
MAVVTIAAMALSAPATAFITSFYDGASGCSGGGGTGARTCGGVAATAHAFTGDPGDSVVKAAILGVYGGGLGVSYLESSSSDHESAVTPGSPNHALDNKGRFEFILFDFGVGNPTILDKVITGWVEEDADITVLAKTGAGDPDPNEKNIAGLTTNGWSLVGHYNGTSDDSQEIDVNSGGTASRLWLVGAFDPDFGGDPNGADRSTTHPKKFDYLKVYALKWDKPTDAVEPATLLLFTAGLLAWLSSRRRTARV